MTDNLPDSDSDSDTEEKDELTGTPNTKTSFYIKSRNRCGKPRKFEIYFDGLYQEISENKVIGKWAVFVHGGGDESWTIFGQEDPEDVKKGINVNSGRMKLMAVDEGLKWALRGIDPTKVIVKIKMIGKDHFAKCLIREWLHSWSKNNFFIGDKKNGKKRPNHDLLESITQSLEGTKNKIIDYSPSDDPIFQLIDKRLEE